MGAALGKSPRSIYIDGVCIRGRSELHNELVNVGKMFPRFPDPPRFATFWRPTMRISRPVIALALPVIVAAACSDSYTTPDAQTPAAGSGATAPGAAGTPPGPGETDGPAPTGDLNPDMEEIGRAHV